MHHLISEAESIRARLLDRLETCSDGIIATAFFTHAAFQELQDAIRAALNRGATLTFLIGRFDYVTDPKAVAALLRLGKLSNSRLRVLFDADFLFHYKVALFRDESRYVVIVGSSNITPKGLSSRGEDNVEIVGHKGLYDRLRRDLWGRIEAALDAGDELAEYSRLYKKYRRLRTAINRANDAAARKSGNRRRRRMKVAPLDLSTMSRITYCGISGYINDKKINKGADREVAKAKKSGIAVPNKWVKVPSSEFRLYSEGEHFLVTEDDRRIIGIAACTRKAEVLDSNSKRAFLVFYRYSRGRRFRFPTETTYLKQRNSLHAGNKTVLHHAAMRTIERVFSSLSRRNRPPE